MATYIVAKFAKLVDPTLIQYAGLSKRIAGSQLRFQRIKLQKNSLLCIEIW